MTNTIIEISILSVVLIFFASLMIANIRLRVQNNGLKANLTQETLDKIIIKQEVQKLMSEIDQKTSSQNDGFLRFVSDSREAAFKYIEEVQGGIKEFDEKIGPVVKHYRETGKTSYKKLSELVKDLSEAYDKLMKSMPEEDSV